MNSGEVFCVPHVPHQNGALWIRITEDSRVVMMDPAGAWWRGKVFSLDEFNKILIDGRALPALQYP